MRTAGFRLLVTTALAGVVGLSGCEQSADTEADAPAAAPEDIAEDITEDAAANTDAAACDRQCVLDVLDAYVTALGAGVAADAPLAGEVAFVENLTRMEPGEGLWADIRTGPGAFQIRVPDPELQSAGYVGLMQRAHPPLDDDATDAERADAEDGVQDVLVAIRLQLEDGLVSEAEHLVAPIANPDWLENLRTVRPGFQTEIPENRRLPHNQLIEIGAAYYEALDNNDADLFPFAADCERRENGILTAGGDRPQPGPGEIAVDCYGQIESGAFQYIDRIDNRRMFAADPVTGLAMGLSHFRQPMNRESWTVTAANGQQIEREMTNAPFDMPAAHVFKVGPEGQVHEIEAVGVSTPYDSPTGWE